MLGDIRQHPQGQRFEPGNAARDGGVQAFVRELPARFEIAVVRCRQRLKAEDQRDGTLIPSRTSQRKTFVEDHERRGNVALE